MPTRTVIFRTSPVQSGRVEYYSLAADLFKLAAATPGFVAAKTFTASDGEEMTVVEFESDEALNTWRSNAAHQAAMKSSSRFFADYRITVFGDPIRDYGVADTRAYRK